MNDDYCATYGSPFSGNKQSSGGWCPFESERSYPHDSDDFPAISARLDQRCPTC